MFFLLSIGLLFLCFRKILCYLNEKRKAGSTTFREKELYLVSGKNDVLQKLLKHAGVYNDKVSWLSPPGSLTDKRNNIVYSLSLLSTRVIFWCAFDSLRLYFMILKRKGYEYVLEVNSALDWLLYYWTLQSINPNVTLYFCQTYAPIIVAIGRAPQYRKIHIQHGSLVLRTNIHNIEYPMLQHVQGYDCWTVNSPYKLSNIELAYSFSEREFAAECLSIFKSKPRLCVIGYNLKQADLVEVENTCKSVLIIAFYRAYKDRIEELVRELSTYNVSVLLKVHPQDSPVLYDAMHKEYGVTVFSGKVFPKADMVLSYESTLALEYEALGFDVRFFHIKEVGEVIEEVVKTLSLTMISK